MTKPPKIEVAPHNIPVAMKSRDQWVMWRWRWQWDQSKNDGEGGQA